MKRVALMGLAFLALSGGASTSNDVETATNPAKAATQTVESAATSSEISAEKVDLPASCKTPIAAFIQKMDATIEVMTESGIVYRIDKDDNVTEVLRVSDAVNRYALVPMVDTILHVFSDRLMLEDMKGRELFRLEGDASNPHIFFSSDASEVAIQASSRQFNVWKTAKGFGAVASHERVQDFVNRQMADHFLKFPNDVRAMALGSGGHVAVAMDDETAGKKGLLYHLDSVGAPGKLAVLARTNTTVQSMAISPNADSVAAVDDSGQLFVAGTDKKGFYGFSKDYRGVLEVVYHGSNPVVVMADRIVEIDIASGEPRYTLEATPRSCRVYDASIYCLGKEAIDVYRSEDGAWVKRYGFGQRDASCVLRP